MSERLQEQREAIAHWVERDKQRLSRALDDLETSTRETIDVGQQAARHAWAWLVVGLFVGLLFGARVGRRRRLLMRAGRSRP